MYGRNLARFSVGEECFILILKLAIIRLMHEHNITIEMLTSPGCHNCARFLEFWEGVKGEWLNASFKEVDIMTPEGKAMVQKHMIMATPGMVINGELFSTGGVNTGEFLEKLKELSEE